MRPISRLVRKIIDNNPFYRFSVITGKPNPSMQHCWIYGGTQIGDAFAIVPLDYEYNTSHPPRDVVDKCQIVSLIRATPEDLAKYPRMDWNQKKKYLFAKHPEFYKLALKKYGPEIYPSFAESPQTKERCIR